MIKTPRILLPLLCISLMLGGCQSLGEKDQRLQVTHGHLDKTVPEQVEEKQTIPPLLTQVPVLAAPKPREKPQTYTVVVNNVPAQELLFALARDARLNLDIDPDISGNVSINAIDQTLPQILKRISSQISLRYYLDGPNLIVQPDEPYFQVYRVDYLNVTRTTTSTVSVETQIASTGTVSGGGGGGGNNSSTTVNNSSDNKFWVSLEQNLLALAGNGGQVISNRESGTVSVRANSAAHEKIAEFLGEVLSSARRQVLIEATVVEVTLNDEFQAGVDWSRIANGNGWSFQQSLLGGALGSTPFLAATYNNTNNDRNIGAALRALKSFGDVSVMSSPKIMALNNQTSVLKVVDNRVYFTTEIEEKEATNNSAASTTFTTTINTVPVGFVMNVTPYITENSEIILNIRPTISRILQFVNDPNPGFAAAGVVNQIPEIQVREMESVLRVQDGDTAVIGGLMQDSNNDNKQGLPGLSDIRGLDLVFGTKQRISDKTELVIFLRPRVIQQASLEGELSDFKQYLSPPALQPTPVPAADE